MSVNLVLSMNVSLNGPRNLFLNITLINNEDEDYFVDMEAFHLTALHCGSPSISVVGPSQEYEFSVRVCRSVGPNHYSRNIASDYYQSSFRKILSGEGVEVHYNIPGSFLDNREYHDVEFTVPGAYTVLFTSHTSCCTQEQAQSLYSTSFEEVMYYCTDETEEDVELIGEAKFEVFPNHFQTEQSEL